MPSNCGGEECHQYLCPPMLIYNGKNAIADSEPDEGGGIDFDAQGDCAVGAEVADIFAKDAVVYQPIIQSV